MSGKTEPLVRIRCDPDEEARCRAALARAGFEAERSLTWLVVRDASPDAVNEALAAGGARPRVAVRQRIGQLIGWLLDREGKLEGRGVNVQALVRRVLEEGGLAERYRPKPLPALLAGAAVLHGELVATAAGFVPWDRFVELFCDEAALDSAPP
ncbi:MAG TPA: hypothetical protein VLC54_07080 [Anaeromyxobacter sp.]|nr:hypothetical protein [Anaeromyxobacter sp.]